MTREEAISFLQSRIDLIDKNYPQIEDYREALVMAIKALEQTKTACTMQGKLKQQKEQEVYVVKGMLSDDELKHIGEQMKKVSLQLISAKQEPCADCISRETLLKYLETITKDTNPRRYVSKNEWYHDNGFNLCKVRIEKFVENLAPATPQPKIGRWLAKSFHEVYCDNCGFDFDIMTNEFINKMRYCPNCGAKMGGGQNGFH